MGTLDPALKGHGAIAHPAVIDWHYWVLEKYSPSEKIILITPCGKIKPYPKNPQSARLRKVLKRLGLWNYRGTGYMGSPKGIEWIYLSDLLLIVPYERAMEYPACCYELSPEELMINESLHAKIINLLSKAFRKLREHILVAYLPSKHRHLLNEALNNIHLDIHWVKYNLFYGHRRLEETLREVIKLKARL